MEAARYWARGSLGEDSRQDDLIAFGSDEATARAWLAEAEEDAPKPAHCSVWSGNWLAVQLFLRLGTQWKYAWNGRRIGLDYAAIPSMLDLLDIKRKKRKLLFDKLQTMEVSALQTMRIE